jgi:hypothetical protein
VHVTLPKGGELVVDLFGAIQAQNKLMEKESP